MLILANQLRLSQKLRILICLMLALACLSPAQVLSAAQERYVVNLLSMKQAIDLNKVSKLSSVQGRYGIIVYSKPLNNTTTNVLSVGYFPDINQASKVARSLDDDFKGAYVSRFLPTYTVLKTIDAKTKRNTTKIVENKTVENKTTAKSAATINADRLDQIMNSARSAIKAGDNGKAIQLFSAVLTTPDSPHSEEALELLGLARERNGQYNHAVNIYNQYIRQYPDGKGTRRVKQRLAVLTTASKRVDTSITTKDRPGRARPWDMSGSLAQSYRANNGDNSDLYTFLDMRGRKKNEDTDIKVQFTGNRTSPLSGDSDTDFHISELYTDLQFTTSGMSTKLGRMRSRSGGLYGRLDGLILSYDDEDITKYNILVGLPVNSAREFLFDSDNDKLVYGVNTDLLFFDKTLDINAYFVEQRNDDLLDRQAIGVEARYFKSDLSVFSLLDYDISYDQTSMFLMSGHWKTSDKVTLFFNTDYRTSPLLTTGNALIGQTETDLGTLAAALGEDAVRQLADDRSSTSQLLSLGVSWPIYSATTVRADVTATTISSTPTSGGVIGTPELGPDYYYSLQFVTNDYFNLRDTTILQFQYTDTATSRKISTLVNTRIPITQKLRVSPRVILALTNIENGEDRSELRTSMRADYKFSRDLHMDIDLGMDFSNIEQPDSGSKLTNYYVVASYQWLF